MAPPFFSQAFAVTPDGSKMISPNPYLAVWPKETLPKRRITAPTPHNIFFIIAASSLKSLSMRSYSFVGYFNPKEKKEGKNSGPPRFVLTPHLI
jgi:hypothetical protein